jgi:integrase
MTIKLAEKGKEKWLSEHAENKRKDDATISTFDEMYDKYKEHLLSSVKESSYVTFTTKFEKHVLPYFTGWKMEKINSLALSDWQDFLSREKEIIVARKNGIRTKKIFYSYKYKIGVRGAFYHFFEFASLHGYDNPFLKVKGFKKDIDINIEDEELNYWTEEEFNIFIVAVDDFMYRVLFYVAYLTGARKGEYLSLKWKDIDFENHFIKIYKTLSNKTISKKYKITKPKTKNAFRKVYLPNNIFDLLQQYKNLISESGTEENFVFGGVKHIPFQTLTNRFNGYIKIAKVKRIKVHELRHSCVSLIINTGGSTLDVLYMIAEHIGDTPEQVLKTYGHLFKQNKMNIIDKLNVQINFRA